MKKVVKFLILISIFSVIFASALLLTAYLERNSRPEFVCSPFTESKYSQVKYCVPNPFRDKNPEQISENYLHALKNNQLETVLPYLRNGGKEPEKTIGREKDLLPVSSWRIINRAIEKDGRYRLSYVYRKNDSDREIPIGFYFVKSQDTWVLDEIESFW